jgi:hypothetical protein
MGTLPLLSEQSGRRNRGSLASGTGERTSLAGRSFFGCGSSVIRGWLSSGSAGLTWRGRRCECGWCFCRGHFCRCHRHLNNRPTVRTPPLLSGGVVAHTQSALARGAKSFDRHGCPLGNRSWICRRPSTKPRDYRSPPGSPQPIRQAATHDSAGEPKGWLLSIINSWRSGSGPNLCQPLPGERTGSDPWPRFRRSPSVAKGTNRNARMRRRLGRGRSSLR